MIIAHAGADDVASLLFVGGVVAAAVAVRQIVRHRQPIVAVAAAVALLAGAAAVTKWARPSVRQAGVRPRSPAQVHIVSPPDGAVVLAGTVVVVLRLTAGHLVAATSTKLEPDQGHVHLLLDGHVVSSTSSLHTTIGGVEPGRHLLEAEFVALDHGPFSPPVRATTTFTASSSSPAS